MSLLGQELKKIWRPGILVGIVLLGLIYYYMFPSFYIEHFSNGPSAKEQFDLSVEWVARYGPTLEPEERAEVDKPTGGGDCQIQPAAGEVSRGRSSGNYRLYQLSCRRPVR